MDQYNDTTIAQLEIEFGETDIESLFANAYDYYFAPRSSKYRALASVEIERAVRLYATCQQLAPWLAQALACKQRSTLAVTDDTEQNLALTIERVLDNNQSFVTALACRETTWARGISILWTLVFVERYGELPQNTPGTPLHYAAGVTDDRWDSLLNTKNAADDKTGYRYMIDALTDRGTPS